MTENETKRVILARRARFVAVALTTAGLSAHGCGGKAEQPGGDAGPQECLSIALDSGADAVDDAVSEPQVCLTRPEDASMEPQVCLQPIEDAMAEPLPCLDPPDDAGIGPEVCLQPPP